MSATDPPVPRGHCGRCDRCEWPFGHVGRRGDICRLGYCSERPLPDRSTHCPGCGAPYEAQPTIHTDDGAGWVPITHTDIDQIRMLLPNMTGNERWINGVWLATYDRDVGAARDHARAAKDRAASIATAIVEAKSALEASHGLYELGRRAATAHGIANVDAAIAGANAIEVRARAAAKALGEILDPDGWLRR